MSNMDAEPVSALGRSEVDVLLFLTDDNVDDLEALPWAFGSKLLLLRARLSLVIVELYGVSSNP